MKASDSDTTPRIRSFGPSRGRGRACQPALQTQGMAEFGVTRPQLLAWEHLFPLTQPCVLEIGFGMGHSLYQIAKKHPERNYIGAEVYQPGVISLLRQLIEAPLPNLKVYSGDAVAVIAEDLPPASLSRVQIYFPDPWPKKRHQKRRLIQGPFLDLLSKVVIPGGWLHLATDWPEYADHMQETCAQSPHWQIQPLPHPEAEREPTKFESRGKALGYPPQDFLYVRV